VPIDVEGRHEQDRHPLEQPGCDAPGEQFAQGDEPGVLPIALARVDATLEHQQRQLPRVGARDQQRTHRPALRRAAELEITHRIGPSCLERRA
jgi:hypothetical protein